MSDDLVLSWLDHVSRALARNAGPILSFVVILSADEKATTAHVVTLAAESALPILQDEALIPHFQAIADAIGAHISKLVRQEHPEAKAIVLYRHVDDAPPKRRKK